MYKNANKTISIIHGSSKDFAYIYYTDSIILIGIY